MKTIILISGSKQSRRSYIANIIKSKVDDTQIMSLSNILSSNYYLFNNSDRYNNLTNCLRTHKKEICEIDLEYKISSRLTLKRIKFSSNRIFIITDYDKHDNDSIFKQNNKVIKLFITEYCIGFNMMDYNHMWYHDYYYINITNCKTDIKNDIDLFTERFEL